MRRNWHFFIKIKGKFSRYRDSETEMCCSQLESLKTFTCLGCTRATRATSPQGLSLTRRAPSSSSSSGGFPKSGGAPAACPSPPACGWGWRTWSGWGCWWLLSAPSTTRWAGMRGLIGGHLPKEKVKKKKVLKNWNETWTKWFPSVVALVNLQPSEDFKKSPQRKIAGIAKV